MADNNWTRNVVCRYYKNGACRDGENCRYRHTDSLQESDSEDNTESSLEITPKVPQNVPCRFFKWGTCKFGNRCKFNHVTPVQRQEAKSSDNATPSSSSSTLAQGSSSTNETRNGEEEEEEEEEEDEGRSIKAEEWVNAPEFVPSGFILEDYNSPVSYAKAVSNTAASSNPASEPLCPYAEASGFCKKLDCNYLHGDICDLCGRAAMHPYNKELSQKHVNECIKQHEVDMELSFAIQRSRDKTCGVCFEIVMDKSSREQRFGILPNCNHCFCLSCIRKWRQAKQFDNKIIRSCPECRVPSDFVCPSPFWVDTKEEKEKLIVEYKGALSQKDCKYFNKGQGKCPFGNKCFYMHALPDGTKTDVGPPSRQSASSEAELGIIHQLLLWNFLEERDNGWIYVDDHDEVVVLFSDSEDSDWSRLGAQD